MRSLIAQVPTGKLLWDLGASPVTTSAWKQLIAAMLASACAVEVYNGSNSTLEISTGAVGAEDASAIPYYILPGGSSILLPINFSRGAPVSVKAVDQNTTAGLLILNFFG